MKKTSKISRLFRFFWFESDAPNSTWDELLNLLMDKGEVTAVNEYTMTFNNKYIVWIENHPYSSGFLRRIRNDDGSISYIHSISEREFHCKTSTKIRLEDFYYNYLTSKKGICPLISELEQLKNSYYEQENQKETGKTNQ